MEELGMWMWMWAGLICRKVAYKVTEPFVIKNKLFFKKGMLQDV